MACYLSDKEMTEFTKYDTSWKVILEPTIGNVVISEVDVLTCVVLSKAEKQCLMGNYRIFSNLVRTRI
jgi:hypothetical protein